MSKDIKLQTGYFIDGDPRRMVMMANMAGRRIQMTPDGRIVEPNDVQKKGIYHLVETGKGRIYRKLRAEKT